MIKTKILVLYTLFFFILFQTFAQTGKDAVSLISFLNAIQNELNYNFSYVDNDLKGILIVPLSPIVNIEETINYLKKSTPFNYTKLQDNTIAINKKKIAIEICGILIDIQNESITNASIQSKSKSTISDEKGIFTLQIDTTQEIITINYLGYQTKKIAAKELVDTPCKKITLVPKIENLNQIVLNNYLIKGINKQPNGSIRIDYNNFGILPGLIEPDLLQTIQALPGILSANETISNINVRGGTNDQNLILWDGIKMYQSSHFFGLISAFNPYLTKNITLSKNGSSAVYGDGVSSVISMSTSNKVATTLDTSVGLNLISVDGYLDTPINNKSSLQVAARRSINEVLETPTYNQFFDKAFQDSEVINGSNSDDQFSFYDASIRWLYQLTDKDLIKVNALLMRNDLVFQENTTINQENIARESSITQNNNAGGILYQRNWSTNFQSELLIYATNYSLKAVNSDIENDQRLLQENDVLENGIKVNTALKLGTNSLLKSGYQFNETGISNLQDVNNPTFRKRTKEVVRTHSLFSELNYVSKSKKNIVNAGLRINYFDKFDILSLEPRISFLKKIPSHFTLEILGEIKSQTTSQVIDLQNDFLGIENRRWILSNDQDIPIIKSKQISTGLSYNHYNWLISTDFYYKDVNGIITRSQGFQNQYEPGYENSNPENIHGSYSVFGIDFLINKRFRNFSTWVSYSYADNIYNFDRLDENNFPNNIDIRHTINVAVAYNLQNLKFSGGINWHSGKPSTQPTPTNTIENNRINYVEANSTRIEDYMRVDVSTTYKFKVSKKANMLAGVSIWNLLDQKNITNEYYKISNQDAIEKIEEFGLGFTPNVVVRLNF